MLHLYEQYELGIAVFLNVLFFSLFVYFFLMRARHKWYRFYWSGALWIFLGGILLTLNLLVSLSGPLALVRKAITLLTGCYGFYLSLMGWRSEQAAKKEKADISSGFGENR